MGVKLSMGLSESKGYSPISLGLTQVLNVQGVLKTLTSKYYSLHSVLSRTFTKPKRSAAKAEQEGVAAPGTVLTPP